MTKIDEKLALLDTLVDSTALDPETGHKIKALARQVAIAVVQEMKKVKKQVAEGTNGAEPEPIVAVKEGLETPNGMKIVSYGANR